MSVAQKCFQILCWLKCSDENDGVDWNLELHCFSLHWFSGQSKSLISASSEPFHLWPPTNQSKITRITKWANFQHTLYKWITTQRPWNTENVSHLEEKFIVEDHNTIINCRKFWQAQINWVPKEQLHFKARKSLNNEAHLGIALVWGWKTIKVTS